MYKYDSAFKLPYPAMHLWVHHFKWAYEDFTTALTKEGVIYFAFAALLCTFPSDMVRFGCLFNTGALFSRANALIDLALINAITYSLTHSLTHPAGRLHTGATTPLFEANQSEKRKKKEKWDQSIFLQHFSPFVGCATLWMKRRSQE